MIRLTAAGLAAALAVLWGASAGWAVDTSPGNGWLRLAHFSPDTPKVDVYLAPLRSPDRPTVFPAVGYGALSEYTALPTGRYAISMRPAGAPASSPPVITTNVNVEGGQAYTVAGLGRNASLALRVLGDDLSSPPAGHARVRVIQASAKAPVVTLAEQRGRPLFEAARFATASPYVNVPAGFKRLALTVADQGRPLTSATLQAAAGAVYSLVVLDEPAGVKVLVRDDARSAARAPVGGVDTGLGGMSFGRGAVGGTAGVLAALAVVLAAAGLAVLRAARVRAPARVRAGEHRRS